MTPTRGFGDVRLGFQYDFAIQREARQHSLFENHQVFLLESEKIVAAEKFLRRLFRVFTCHDVPVANQFK